MGIESGPNPMEEIAAAEAQRQANLRKVAELGGVNAATVEALGKKLNPEPEEDKAAAPTPEEAQRQKNQESVAQLAGVSVETVKAAGDEK